ncbi:hypothetical protein SCUP234_11394 [Seiridium cupressi]
MSQVPTIREGEPPRLDSPTEQVDESPTQISSRTSSTGPLTASTRHLSGVATRMRPHSGVMAPTMAAVENLSSRIDAIRSQQQQQSRDRHLAQTDFDELRKSIGAVNQASNALKRRIDTLEDLDQSQDVKRLQAAVSELKQELATTKKHQQQWSRMAVQISRLLNPSVEMNSENSNSPKESQIYETPQTEEIAGAKTELILLLPLLHKMDFRDPDDRQALKKIEDYEVTLSLFLSDEMCENELIAYSVRCRGPFGNYLVPGDRKHPDKVSTFWCSPEWADFPSTIELSDHREDGTNLTLFPKYVWEIGEIYVRRTVREANQWTDRSTGYHLVIDVTTPAKSVWMVYRYAEHGDHGRIERNVKKLKDPFWHPFAPITQDSFDAAQVFAKVKDWHGEETPAGQFKKAAQLVKATGRNFPMTPTFVRPLKEEVKKVIEKGWNRVEKP